MALAVFLLILMSRTILTPTLLMVLTILPIRAIGSAIFLLPGASTRSTAFFRTAVLLILDGWMTQKFTPTMKTDKD